MTSFSIEIGDDAATTLREIAEATAETPETLIRQAVEELVADYVNGRIAVQRLAGSSDEVIAREPAGILALAVGTLADVSASERDLLTQKLGERER
jgi:hypothetical protein